MNAHVNYNSTFLISLAGNNFCWNVSCDFTAHHSVFSVHDLSQIDNSFSSLWMDADIIGYVTHSFTFSSSKQVAIDLLAHYA